MPSKRDEAPEQKKGAAKNKTPETPEEVVDTTVGTPQVDTENLAKIAAEQEEALRRSEELKEALAKEEELGRKLEELREKNRLAQEAAAEQEEGDFKVSKDWKEYAAEAERAPKKYKVKFIKSHTFQLGLQKYTAKEGSVMEVEKHVANQLMSRQIAFII